MSLDSVANVCSSFLMRRIDAESGMAVAVPVAAEVASEVIDELELEDEESSGKEPVALQLSAPDADALVTDFEPDAEGSSGSSGRHAVALQLSSQ